MFIFIIQSNSTYTTKLIYKLQYKFIDKMITNKYILILC